MGFGGSTDLGGRMTDGNAPVARGYPVTPEIGQSDAAELYNWIREPDWAENFSLADIVAWIEKRPIAAAYRLAREANPAITDALTPQPASVAQAAPGCGTPGCTDPSCKYGQDECIFERVFKDACDEIGCAYDNEALLQAIHDLKTSARLLADAQKIIAEYKAGTTAGAKADVAAHGMPGARDRSMPDSGAWQPIETCDPKHELNVLVVDDGVVSEAYYDGESDAWFKEGKSEHDFNFVDSDRLFPTHWMPMPAPPSPVPSTASRPFYGAECPSYPDCSGGCGLGCTKEIESAKASALTSTSQKSPADVCPYCDSSMDGENCSACGRERVPDEGYADSSTPRGDAT
jgi:hypothetical protein